MEGLHANNKFLEPASPAETLLNLNNPGVLVHKNKKFAVNLLWLTLDEAAGGFDGRNLILKTRRSLIQPDFVGDRSLVVSQQGYGHLKKGHRMGMPAAAAVAADLLVGEWHGCFKADNGWWYVAVHDDAIAPEGDRFFQSEEDAYNHFMAAMNAQHWPRAYAIEEWAIPSTTSEITLEKLLDNLPSTYLKPLNLNAVFGNPQNKILFLISAIVVGFLVMAFSVTGIGDYFKPLPPLQKTVVIGTPVKISSPPRFAGGLFGDANDLLKINDYPAPVLIRSCLSSMEKMYKTLPGWSLQSITCGGGAVTAAWSNNKARLADLNKLRNRFEDAATMTLKGATDLEVSQPWDLDGIEKLEMQVFRKELLYAMMIKRFESKGVLALADIKQETTNTIDPNTGLPVAVDNPARNMSFDFTSSQAAYLWADDFDIPGVKPLQLEWSVPNSQWNINGQVQYQ